MFPTVPQIPVDILQKVDSSHPVLLAYLKTMDPSIEMGVLLPIHEINRQGVVIHEIPTLVSPVSKNKIAEDKAKKISKKNKRKIVEDSLEEEVVPELPLHDTTMNVPSPTTDSPIKTSFEEIGNLGGFVKTSNVDTTTTEVSEEVRTSGILVDISNMDTNINKGEGVLNPKVQGNHNIIILSSFKTSTVDTSTSLPPFHSTISTSTHSATFDNILNQPVISLFPTQSTNPKTFQEDENEDSEFMGTFTYIEFDLEEENIPDHMLMSGKQFKIHN
ncbi:unnamed protein product [Lactuca saligna]|uniref:Uncharacterized protein n=1 Tax=Lactuca saligna TaxID=75948 RepID=A0AA36ENR1_LACSI|nr:unnamed protein product [Lactuca saligna]